MSSPESPAAFVVTFYSFKGGVGRSLLMANVGWLLSSGSRVLLWDLDVEAPGLHRIPDLRPAQVPRGFFEWLTEWVGEESGASDVLTERQADSLRKLVQPVPDRQNLSILPAFADGAKFADVVAREPWRKLVAEDTSRGLKLFQAICGTLAESCDFLLIDSRTGITHVGGLLASLLPHVTVLVGGYGNQSLYGLLQVKKALQVAASGRLHQRDSPGPDSKLLLVHVASPVPSDPVLNQEIAATSRRLASERREVWRSTMEEVDPIEVPFDPRLLWHEMLLAKDDRLGLTAQAYQQTADRLASLRSEWLESLDVTEDAGGRYPEMGDPHDRKLDPHLRAQQGTSFERRVARLLEFRGYEVEREQILGGNKVDLVARRQSGLDDECWWVECKDHKKPAGKDVLERIVSWTSGDEGRRQRARPMVVARGFSPAARSFAHDHPKLKIWTAEELERTLIDPRPLLHRLVTRFETSPLSNTYVRQHVLLEKRKEEEATVDLLDHAMAWSRGAGSRLWVLLGDYGTGKSAFFRRFSYELARRALDDPEQPFPVAIDLKKLPNATSAETLFYEHVRRQMPRAQVEPEAIRHLLSSGRVILLLDSFDEMGLATAGRSVEEQFRELARLAGEEPIDAERGNRVLITCRTHFFRDQQQVKDTASGSVVGLQASEDSALGRVARRFDATLDELRVFSEAQVDEFLVNHLGPQDAERARQFIGKTYDLATLAPRPQLLEMIVESLPKLLDQVHSSKALTSADLYEVYTRRWLEEKAGSNLVTTAVQRHDLLTLLAASLWRREERRIHYRELLTQVQQLSSHFPGLDYDRVDIELRTAAFLVRTKDGYYRFSHKSFLEYFLARHIARGLCEGRAEGRGPEEAALAAAVLDLPPLTPEVANFFWQLPDERLRGRREALTEILTQPYRTQVSENALRLGAWARRHREDPLEVAGACLAGARLDGLDLSGISLPSADLSKADLAGVDLVRARLPGAVLDRAVLDRASLVEAELTGASLQDASLIGADLTAAKLPKANLSGARLRAAFLDRADLSAADLSGADLAFASGDGTLFQGADLTGVDLDRSAWAARQLPASASRGADWLSAGAGRRLPARLAAQLARRSARVGPARGHEGSVWSVAWGSGGELASCGDDGSVRVWDVASGESRSVLRGHEGRVLSVAWGSGGELASCGDDGSVRVWDVASGESRSVLRGHEGRVWSVAWGSGGELASCGSDGSVRVWDVASGESRSVLRGHEGSVWSVAWGSGGELASCGDDGSVRVWDVASGEEILTLFLRAGASVAAVAGGWFRSGGRGGGRELVRTLRLHLCEEGAAAGSSYRVFPLGGLARLLESPERVEEAVSAAFRRR